MVGIRINQQLWARFSAAPLNKDVTFDVSSKELELGEGNFRAETEIDAQESGVNFMHAQRCSSGVTSFQEKERKEN